ncbi:L-type lectin-domain containing receptor kinase IX.1-like [Humulus lupulus]|uniref:L-type lectin-domain containing receptor kinase IX.1-like n=1 Tax=Humulus lupulus TaxID=3486 RepID=UPI002B41041D|nr:L-type lectin-domain containing receptor kinase IX.1-like [Humulus lupulus]
MAAAINWNTSQTLLFPLLLFCLPILSHSIHFQITRFVPNDPRVLYQGDAAPSVGAVEFNDVGYLCRTGRVISAEPLRLWDACTKTLTDFTSRFSFTIDTLGRANYAAGLAFFLAPVGYQIPPNSAGGFLGLFNTTTSDLSKNQIVTVEFDSFANPEWDPSAAHVGINYNSIASATYTPWNASYHSRDTADALISYNATTKNLSVVWSYRTTSTKTENTSLSYRMNLMKILPEWVTVGFSAATSHLVERHVLQSWEFSSSLVVKERSNRFTQKGRFIVSFSVSGAVLIAGVGLIIAFVVLRKRKRNRGQAEAENLTSVNYDLERGAGVPRRFSYEDLASATNNFSSERKLGEGGFGAVYRGYLRDLDMLVAVKKISRGSKQGKKEYLTEVKVISSLRHRNLVQLIGWCHDRSEFLLVYEFMPNGSLDSHLFGRRSPLTWAVRYKISLGIASALLYLHEEWEQCVVHRDIKSSNVMLDSSFNVKLSDFGLARLMDHELGPQTTGLVGTLGYLAPEYISTRKASKESDVYSFGVVALEIATGKRATYIMDNDSEMGLVEWVWDLYGKGELILAMEGRLHIGSDQKQVENLMIVGLWCAHPDRNFRPTIRQALQVLKLEAALPNLPTKMPVAVYQIPTPSLSSGDPLITTSLEVDGR